MELIGTVSVEATDPNGHPKVLDWELQTTAFLPPWLQVDPTSGKTPSTMTLTFHCRGIVGGGALITFSLIGTDPATSKEAVNRPVVAVEWTVPE